jgi:hypothetical protein
MGYLEGTALDLPHDWFGGPVGRRYEWHEEAGGWIERLPGDSTGQPDRFVRLDGSPIASTAPEASKRYGFEPSDRAFYRYASNGRRYIVFSAGPDGDDDATTETRMQYLETGDRTALAAVEYDPTNGVQSSGDIFLTDVD